MRQCLIAMSFSLVSTAIFAAEVDTAYTPWWVPEVSYSGKTIGAPAEIAGVNGFKVGPDDKLYIASVQADEIVVMNRHTGNVESRIKQANAIKAPDDIVFAADGTMYWTMSTGEVGLRKPSGEFRVQSVSPFINPIAINNQGRIVVAASFFGEGLYELDPELINPPRTINGSITELNGFDFGPDGFLYAPRLFSGEILRIDIDTGATTLVASGFKTPSGVAFNSAGEMYVLDSTGGDIWRVDTQTGNKTFITNAPGLWDNIAFSQDDVLYASNAADGQMFRLVNNTLVPLNGKGLIAPGGFALDDQGHIWVGDLYSLKRHNPNGQLLQTYYGSVDPGEPGFSTVNTVSYQGNNKIVVTGWADNKVQVRDSATGAVVQNVADLKIPSNALFHRGSLHATQLDIGYGGVVRVPDRKQIIDWVILPTGLASSGKRIYVADWLLGAVWSLDQYGIRRLDAIGLSGPEGIHVVDNWLFVVEGFSNELSAVNLITGATYRLVQFAQLGADNLSGTVPFGVFNDVKVNAAANKLYVSSDRTRKIYEFALSMP